MGETEAVALASGVAIAYGAVLAGLAFLGAHRLLMVMLAARRPPEETPPRPLGPDAPTLLLQLPIFNEASVVDRLLDAAAALRYPQGRLRIQVLDDSTDETPRLVARKVQALQARGLAIAHLRRSDRSGFKAGALAEGLRQDDSELVAIFDADFVPEPDFLERMAPLFQDPTLGCAQARWGHLNRDASLLTRVQAIFLDAHFRVEQHARSSSGRFFNFNGTAGVWRRRAIDEAGGWAGDTLTEDLDLSLRAQMIGWRFDYRDDVVAPAELPESFRAFRGQQHRWAKGAGETLRKLLPLLWTAPDVPLKARIEASFQLGLNASYPLVCLLALLTVPLVGLGLPIGEALLWVDLAHLGLIALASLCVCLFFLASQGREPRRVLEALLLLPFLLAFGVGLALLCARAYLTGLAKLRSAFVRTPKKGDRASERYRARLALREPAAELLLGCYLLSGFYLAAVNERWLAVPFIALLAAGFLGIGGATFAETAAGLRRPPEEASSLGQPPSPFESV